MWRDDLQARATTRPSAWRRPSVAGFRHEETLELLRAWAARQSRPLPDGEIVSVVASAFARPFPYTYGCHDEVIRAFCPYSGRLFDCADYRDQHPRSGRDGAV
jgi:hypothetical protein